VTSKDFYLALKGKMLIEIPDFKSFKGIDADALKAAITRPTDTYRAPYERRTADHPRQCVFSATINRKEWMNDATGGRRFWPVRCGSIDLQWLTDNREQLFAEAVWRVRSSPDGASALMRTSEGSAWWDVDTDLASEQQEQRQKDDSIAPAIKEWCHNYATQGFTVLQVARGPLGLNEAQSLDERLAQRIKDQLTRWGFEAREGEGGVREWSRPHKA
jgi:predicted P-loop ATPase